jgi:hypothetical protein
MSDSKYSSLQASRIVDALVQKLTVASAISVSVIILDDLSPRLIHAARNITSNGALL